MKIIKKYTDFINENIFDKLSEINPDQKEEIINNYLSNRKKYNIKNLNIHDFEDIFDIKGEFHLEYDEKYTLLQIKNFKKDRLNIFLSYFRQDFYLQKNDFILIKHYKKYNRTEEETHVYAVFDDSKKEERSKWSDRNDVKHFFSSMVDDILYMIKDIINYDGYFNDRFIQKMKKWKNK